MLTGSCRSHWSRRRRHHARPGDCVRRGAAHLCSTICVRGGDVDEGASARMLLRILSPRKYHAARMSIARANARPSHEPVPSSWLTRNGSFGTASRIPRKGSNVMQHLASKAARPVVGCPGPIASPPIPCRRRPSATSLPCAIHSLVAYDDHGLSVERVATILYLLSEPPTM